MANPVSDQQGIPKADTPVLQRGFGPTRNFRSEDFYGMSKDDIRYAQGGQNSASPGGLDAQNLMDPTWYKFLNYLWKISGGGSGGGVPSKTAQLSTDTAADGTTTAAATPVQNSDSSPAASPPQQVIIQTEVIPATPATPGMPFAIGALASPQVWHVTANGTLIVTAAQVELSRQNSAWIVVSLAGGAIPAKLGDQFRLTWFRDIPTFTFFPDS